MSGYQVCHKFISAKQGQLSKYMIWKCHLFLKVLCFLFFFFLIWTVFKVFIEFVTLLLLIFYVLVFWPWGMWDLCPSTRDGTGTPFIGRTSPTTGPPEKSLKMPLDCSSPVIFSKKQCDKFKRMLVAACNSRRAGTVPSGTVLSSTQLKCLVRNMC